MTAAALFWASSGVAGKALFAAGITPAQLVQTRLLVATGALALFLAVRAPRLLRLARWRDAALLAVLGAVLALTQLSYFFAISKIHVAAAILLQYMAPVFIAAFAFGVWRERVTAAKLAALVLAVGGCYLVVGGHDVGLLQQNRLGIGAGLASALAFATYSLLGEKGMHRLDPWTVLFYATVAAAAVLHLALPPFNPLHPALPAGQLGLLLYIGVFGTAVAFGLYLTGINYLRSTRTCIVATLEPIFAGVLAFALLGEGFALPQLLGASAVLTGVVLLQVTREEDPLSPDHVRNAATNAPQQG